MSFDLNWRICAGSISKLCCRAEGRQFKLHLPVIPHPVSHSNSMAASGLNATHMSLTMYNTHFESQLLWLLQAAPMQSCPEQEGLELVGQRAPHPGGHGHDCGRSSCCRVPQCST